MTVPPPIDPTRHALFLDFDGTLAELVDDPQAVSVPEPVLERLVTLQHALGGALAIVSGRRIADLDRFLAPLRFAAAGVHGLERREAPDGEVLALAGPERLDPVRERLRAGLVDAPELRLEDKGTALVVHYRGHPESAGRARRLVAEAVAEAEADDLTVMHGDNIVEVHLAGMDKGRAVATFMLAEPFRGRVPAYLGDDTTDEFAFAALTDFGGLSVKVGPGDTCATHRLAGVDSVHRWLQGPAGPAA